MTQQELDALMTEVNKDFEALEALAKSESSVPAGKIEAEGEKDDRNGADPVKASLAKEEMAKEGEEPVAQEAASAAEAPAQEEQAPEAVAPEAEQEDLGAIYASMDDEELKEHFEAIMSVAQERWSAEAQGQPEAGAPAAQEEAAPAAAVSPEEEQMLAQSEKASKEVEDLKKSLEDAQKALDEKTKENKEYQEVVEKLGKAIVSKLPQRKALTETPADLAKSEVLTDDSIRTKALALTKSDKLSKSERSTLNEYFLNNGHNKETVVELIKKERMA